MIITITLLIPFSLFSPEALTKALAEGALKSAIAQRRGIKQASMDVKATSALPAQKPQLREYRVWMDGTKLRCDVLTLPDGVGAPTTSCRNCERPDHYVIYDGPRAGGVRLVTLGRLGNVKLEKSVAVIDPRAFGYVLTPPEAMHKCPFDEFLAPMLASPETLSIAFDQNQGGQIVIRAQRPAGGFTSVRIAPGRGYSVEQLEWGSGDGLIVRADSVLQQDDKSKTWYPKQVTIETRQGAALLRQDVFELSAVKLNEPIAPDTFSLSTMNIPPGTTVAGPALEKPHIWDGKKIAPRKRATQEQKQGPTAPVQPVRRWLLVAAVVLLCIGCAVFVFFGRSTPKAAQGVG